MQPCACMQMHAHASCACMRAHAQRAHAAVYEKTAWSEHAAHAPARDSSRIMTTQRDSLQVQNREALHAGAPRRGDRALKCILRQVDELGVPQLLGQLPRQRVVPGGLNLNSAAARVSRGLRAGAAVCSRCMRLGCARPYSICHFKPAVRPPCYAAGGCQAGMQDCQVPACAATHCRSMDLRLGAQLPGMLPVNALPGAVTSLS